MNRRRILVLQLCRLGDLIQTTPMLRALRASQPDAHVSLVVLDGFAHAPIPRRLYDELLPFPFGPVTALTAAVPSRWQDAVREVRSFVRRAGLEPYDQIVNVTGSSLSNLLATVIPSNDVQGGTIAADRTRVVRGPWMTYFWASIVARAQGCFNVVDVMTRSAGLHPDGRGPEIEVPQEARERMHAWLAGQGVVGAPLIAVQVGASDERKRWPRHRVAAALDSLPAEWGQIVFVGTKEERALVDEARQALKRPSLDASGATSVEGLGALLSDCRLLLSNDTGTMHVAAAVGTRVVDLSTGPVYVHETGPYGVGHLAVEPTISCFPCAPGSVCSHLSCRDDFTPARSRRHRRLRARAQPIAAASEGARARSAHNGDRTARIRSAVAAIHHGCGSCAPGGRPGAGSRRSTTSGRVRRPRRKRRVFATLSRPSPRLSMLCRCCPLRPSAAGVCRAGLATASAGQRTRRSDRRFKSAWRRLAASDNARPNVRRLRRFSRSPPDPSPTGRLMRSPRDIAPSLATPLSGLGC